MVWMAENSSGEIVAIGYYGSDQVWTKSTDDGVSWTNFTAFTGISGYSVSSIAVNSAGKFVVAAGGSVMDNMRVSVST